MTNYTKQVNDDIQAYYDAWSKYPDMPKSYYLLQILVPVCILLVAAVWAIS